MRCTKFADPHLFPVGASSAATKCTVLGSLSVSVTALVVRSIPS